MGENVSTVTLNMYLTLGIAVGALYLGTAIRKKVRVLSRFCVPAPVIGGGIVAICIWLLDLAGILVVTFDETLKDVCMVFFFTTVGYSMNIKVLKSGGIMLLRLVIVVALIAFLQNGIAIGLATLLGVKPLAGLCAGSISMLGGHGTSAAFGPLLEESGIAGASALCAAAATFGLIGGSLIGGPIGNSLILKKGLLKQADVQEEQEEEAEEEAAQKHEEFHLLKAGCHLALAVGIGSVVSWLISMTGLVFPQYLGGLIVGAVISNLGHHTTKFKVYERETRAIGEIMLDFFLGIALVTLRIRMLADLAIPLLVMLSVQVLFMAVFARFVVFRILGSKYDSAVLTAGVCGFGLGATPNAMANAQSVTYGRPRSKTAYLLIPITGGLCLDLINSFTIVFFINLLK